MDYLRVKLFKKIGVSEEAHCLKCPGGHSWGDSAILCSARDLLLVARFVMNEGNWNGEQILNAAYLTDATSFLIDTNNNGINHRSSQGYGYLFWRTYDNAFYFNGMGCQFAVCVPDKDLIFVYNGDNQNDPNAGHIILDSFFKMIVEPACDTPVSVNVAEQQRLETLRASLKLTVTKGEPHSDWESRINGATYQLYENPMGIHSMRFDFADDNCTWYYENEQGSKHLAIGLGKNAFGIFPQEGYGQSGCRSTRSAFAAGWLSAVSFPYAIPLTNGYSPHSIADSSLLCGYYPYSRRDSLIPCGVSLYCQGDWMGRGRCEVI